MGRNWDENSTNVRIEHQAEEPSVLWTLLSDWTVGELDIDLGSANDAEPSLDYELFHRETREGVLPGKSGS